MLLMGEEKRKKSLIYIEGKNICGKREEKTCSYSEEENMSGKRKKRVLLT